VGELFLVRHGATEWSETGRHTGRTDLPLTPLGERQAAGLGSWLAGHRFARVLCSPMQRARRTADLAGLVPFDVRDDLREWDYGRAEGRTTAEVRTDRPGWSLWRDGPPGGESVEDVGLRADAVLAEVADLVAGPDSDGLVALVGHGHQLRILTARWLGQPPAAGRLYRLDPATVSVLGWEHDWRVIRRWNLPTG
jgi:broad specificity phosphatase PhoE